mmetsp:Transcript_25186/g.56653  ORF Transcript_25186/g.56653 Transcript_25186/m.56653 type:complete len:287 (+) Transcript_25186:2133-2993(+)
MERWPRESIHTSEKSQRCEGSAAPLCSPGNPNEQAPGPSAPRLERLTSSRAADDAPHSSAWSSRAATSSTEEGSEDCSEETRLLSETKTSASTSEFTSTAKLGGEASLTRERRSTGVRPIRRSQTSRTLADKRGPRSSRTSGGGGDASAGFRRHRRNKTHPSLSPTTSSGASAAGLQKEFPTDGLLLRLEEAPSALLRGSKNKRDRTCGTARGPEAVHSTGCRPTANGRGCSTRGSITHAADDDGPPLIASSKGTPSAAARRIDGPAQSSQKDIANKARRRIEGPC